MCGVHLHVVTAALSLGNVLTPLPRLSLFTVLECSALGHLSQCVNRRSRNDAEGQKQKSRDCVLACGAFQQAGSLTALSWLRRADQCKDDKPDPGDLDQRQRLTEHNDAKTGRYYRIAKGKERRAHRSDN